MKILITGAGGQLGQELVRLLDNKERLFAFSRSELDVTNSDEVNRIIRDISPEAVIHAAAYTSVNQAEFERDRAYAVNAIGSRNVAAAAAECGAALAYVSTDYVFDGEKGGSYNEFDAPKAINVYGHSKYCGEWFVQSLHPQFYIVRTSWLYSLGGRDFPSQIIASACEGKPIRVVRDEIGSPTYTKDLAEFLYAVIRTNRYGVYHASNGGACSRYEFAKAILEEAGLGDIDIQPVTGNPFDASAKRPGNSSLDQLMIRLSGFTELPPWRDALARCIREIKEVSRYGKFSGDA